MRLFFTIASIFILATAANATVHIVTCQNTPSHFLPVTVNAVVGDTIEWDWVAGNHVVGPISASDIPSGAAMFNHAIDNNNLGFSYVVTKAGTYNYVCHPATPHGENGTIIVASATGIQSYNAPNTPSSAYPNPFSDKITIETPNADMIFIYNFMGEKIKSYSLKNGQTKLEADVAALPKGIFFYSIIKDGAILETKKIIKG